MTLTEMHVWFRQYAQQMGMQNIRAILPEQIDLLINTSITDKVNQIIKENIGLTSDDQLANRQPTDNSKIGSMNALRTLYKVEEINMLPFDSDYHIFTVPFDYEAVHQKAYEQLGSTADFDWGAIEVTAFIKLYDSKGNVVGEITIPNTVMQGAFSSLANFVTPIKESIENSGGINGLVDIDVKEKNIVISTSKDVYTAVFDIYEQEVDEDEVIFSSGMNKDFVRQDKPTKPFIFQQLNAYSGLIKSNPSYTFMDYLYLVDFGLNYTKVTHGYNNVGGGYESDGSFVTNYFPVRLIDDVFLADTLQDFILQNRLRSPILTVYNNNTFDLYIERFKNIGTSKDPSWVLKENLLPYRFRVSYIKRPNKVKYVSDLIGDNNQNVECDLPEYMHVDILKHAVDLYRITVAGALHSQQQQQQQYNSGQYAPQRQYNSGQYAPQRQ